MRLKQLLGVILLLVATATAAAAASQLTDLNVAGNGNVTTVTFRANGTFTHNEYRPTDNLLLVDLAGVAPARFAGLGLQLPFAHRASDPRRVVPGQHAVAAASGAPGGTDAPSPGVVRGHSLRGWPAAGVP